MRFTRITPSAPCAFLSMCTVAPIGVLPITTVSMEERIGAPIASSVMPYSAMSSIWPSAVAPPWLPMAGTMKGFASSFFSSSMMVLMIRAMLDTPRLPAVIAIRCPGLTRPASPMPANSWRTAPATSSMCSVEK